MFHEWPARSLFLATAAPRAALTYQSISKRNDAAFIREMEVDNLGFLKKSTATTMTEVFFSVAMRGGRADGATVTPHSRLGPLCSWCGTGETKLISG